MIDVTTHFTNYTLQDLIKVVLPKDKLTTFLKFYLSDDSIYEFKQLLDRLYKLDREKSNLNTTNKTHNFYYSRIIPLIEFLLYNESLSLPAIKEELYKEDMNIEEIYKNLENKCKNILHAYKVSDDNSITEKQYYLRNYIKYIYYGRTDVDSYADIDNVKNTIYNLFEFTSTSKDQTTEQQIIEKIIDTLFPKNNGDEADSGISLLEEEADDIPVDEYTEYLKSDEFKYHLCRTFMRINDEPAYIESPELLQTISEAINGLPLTLTNYKELYDLIKDNTGIFLNIFQKIMNGTIYYE